MTDTKTAALVAEVERLTNELKIARQAEEIAIANAAGLRRWQERILAAAEAVYGDKSRRFKLCLRKNGTASNVFPDWLDGRWVAFQTAEDDGHIGLVAQLAEAKRDAERYRWLRDIGDATWRPFAIRAGYSAGQADAAIDEAMQRTDAGAKTG